MTKGKFKALKDYIEKKIVSKIELDKHVLDSKFNPSKCLIANKLLISHLNDVAFWNNSKKSEKQEELNKLV